MHEPWKASAQEVYLLRTTDGSVPRGLDPNRVAVDVQMIGNALTSHTLLT